MPATARHGDRRPWRLIATGLTALTLAAAGLAPAALNAQPAVAANPPAIPKLWPTPQQVEPGTGRLAVPSRVVEVLGAHTDASARHVVESTLHAAGATTIVTVTAGQQPPPAALTVYVGGPGENPATAAVLTGLHAASPDGLASGGYELAGGVTGGRAAVALSGVDATGTYYAAQTLRQLVTGHTIPEATIRDWPATAIRGVIEGFYGAPWSQQQRLDQLDFYGRTKQNTYVYSPKDDPYLRAQWRDTYPAAQLAQIKALVDRATADHVQFTYALSPGLSICYSSASDVTALVNKLESMYAIGVRSFAVPLDDISYTTWNCQADKDKFGTGGGAAGAAQASLLNQVQQDFVAKHPDVQPLQMVPTEYSDLADSPYKTALRTKLDSHVTVEWTGNGVIAPTITTAQATQAKQVFGHPILIWDNYPVNDYVTNRLLLGPYTGREPGVPGVVAGVTVNPMIQADASKLAEFTSADYLWNPGAYNPRAAFLASVNDLGGAVAPYLKIFAENNYSSQIDPLESPTLAPLIAAFQKAYQQRSGLDQAARRLSGYFTQMTATPGRLRAQLDDPEFLSETGPWLDKLGAYGSAGNTAVKLLLAYAGGHTAAATTYWNQLTAQRVQLDATPQQVAPGVMDQFVYDTLVQTAPDPGPQASFQPGSLALAPGASKTASITVGDDRSTASQTVDWQLDAPAGVTASPAHGMLTVPAGGKANVTVTLSAAADAKTGVRSVVVGGTSGGKPVVDRAIPVQVSDGRGSERALTADFSDSSVTSIDLGSGSSTKIGVGANPGDVVVSPDGRTAYAANQGSNTVSVIDVAGGKVTATVNVGKVPAGLALSPDGATLWVADYSDDAVQPVDTQSLTAGSEIKVGSGPEDMAVTPDGHTLYVSNSHDNTVSPVDLTAKTAGTPIKVGPNPFDVVAAPDGKTVYVSDSGGSTITPIDTATGKTRPTLLVDGQAYGLGLSPDGGTLWVTTSSGDTATPVDTVTGARGTPVTVGKSAFAVASDWSGSTAYVATADENALVPVDTATGKVGASIGTGAYPLAVAVTQVPVG